MLLPLAERLPVSGADQRNRKAVTTAVCVKVGSGQTSKVRHARYPGQRHFQPMRLADSAAVSILTRGHTGTVGLRIYIGARSGRWRAVGWPRRRPAPTRRVLFQC